MLQNEIAMRWLSSLKKSNGGYTSEVIDLVHQRVHEGVTWTANFLSIGVANNGYARLQFTTDALTEAHVIITVIAEGKSYFTTRSGGTYTGGTAPDANLSVFNRNSGHAVATGVTVVYNPTVSVAGIIRGNQLLNGGTGGSSIGSQSGSRIESIIDPSSSFVIELQNKKGTAGDLCIVLDWYEVKE